MLRRLVLSGALILLTCSHPSPLSSQLLFPPVSPGVTDDVGLVAGKRAMVCPHRSAAALRSFASSDERTANAAKALYAGSRDTNWAYVRMGHQDVPTLMADGNTLDRFHPNNVDLLIYKRPDGTAKQTFIAREYDSGEILTSGSHLLREGVDNEQDISAQIRRKHFAVLHGRLGSEENLDAVVWTNTIVADDPDFPTSGNLSQFRQINEQFARTLPNSEYRLMALRNAFFLTTAKTDKGQELFTNFAMDKSAKLGHLVGYVHSVGDARDSAKMVDAWFSVLPAGSRVYVYGPDISVDFTAVASKYEIQVIRRGPTIEKDFGKTDSVIRTSMERGLRPERTVVFNGIPASQEDLVFMGKPSGDIGVWKDFYGQVEERIEGRYSKRITSKAELIRELTAGNQDVVFLMAHFDGGSLYFGQERVSLDELASLRRSNNASATPRTGVLLICNAGTVTDTQRSFLRKQLKSVGEIFVRNGIFDRVVAPQHEIQSKETLATLTQVMSKEKLSQPGWVTLAEVIPIASNTVSDQP